MDRPLPGHIERDAIERGRLAASGIPPNRPKRHLQEAFPTGRRADHAKERRLRGARGAVLRTLEERSDLRGAHRLPAYAVGHEVWKRHGLEDAERSFHARNGVYPWVDTPRHAEEERDRGELRYARGRVEGAPRERDLGQVLAEDLPCLDIGYRNGYDGAVAGLRDRFDARRDRGGFSASDAGPDGEESEERKRAEGEAQAFAIRSASSINMTGMSSTMG